jgi:alcohol/geraniol dehydrogenase (NADP+)
MSTKIRAYAAPAKGQRLQPFEYDPGALGDEAVEIKVSHCGICHSDLSMLDNDWQETTYPFVPGHEAVGTVVAAGDHVKKVKVGDRVGLGWMAASCMACPQCLSGSHHLCVRREQTIVGRHGAFAERVRCHWVWAMPLPEPLEAAKAGPLFCGGMTVFTPILEFGVKPTEKVGVVGIGGLGHLALQFLNKWGCEVWAFTSSDSKREEALKLGAHHTVSSRDPAQLRKLAGALDFILVTVNVALDWEALLTALAPKGRLHFVGAVPAPVPVTVFSLLGGQKSISGSPVGSPTNMARMLEFCARHGLAPVVEQFPLSRVNEAFEHLRAGKARYRIVLENDIR